MKKLLALFIAAVIFLSSCSYLPFLDEILPPSSGDVIGDNISDDDTKPPVSGDDSEESDPEDNQGETPDENPSDEDNSSDNNDEKPNTPPSNCDNGHTDNDDNGECDYCSVSVIVWFDFYGLNDLHGKVLDSSSQPGLEELSTYLKHMKNTNDNAIFLSSGDMWQGTAESGLTHGLIITDWMNEIGFASMTLGNHEFDWADRYIRENHTASDFPLLAINIYDAKTNKLADYCTPSVVIEQGGFEIGIIGAIGDCYSSISGEVSGGIYFKTGKELTALVKAESERLRAQGVDFIIYSLHDGYDSNTSYQKTVNDSQISSYYDIELSNGYVDLVFEGHTHKSYMLVDSKGVIHLQGGGDNSGLTHAKVTLNSANGNSNVVTVEIVKQNTFAAYAPDTFIDELLEKYETEMARAYEDLGYNHKYRDDSEIEQLVADLYYQVGLEMWADEYDIFLGGGFIRTRSPYNLYSGNVTYSDIYSLLTFDNEIVLCSISGYYLKQKFINSTSSDYYICYDGNDPSIIDNNKTYYIITDTYTSSYKYNNLTEVARYTHGVYARDLVADFIKENGWYSW